MTRAEIKYTFSRGNTYLSIGIVTLLVIIASIFANDRAEIKKDIEQLKKDSSSHVKKETMELQYNEVLRRLDRIEKKLDK